MRKRSNQGSTRGWRSTLRQLAYLAVAQAMVACGGGERPGAVQDVAGEQVGEIIAVVSAADVQPAITRMRISVSPGGVTQDLTFNPSSGVFSGTISSLAIGTYTVSASAFVNTLKVGTGSVTVDVKKGETVTASIVVVGNSVPPAQLSHGPIITSITATPQSVMVGDPVAVQVTATDPDGDTLNYLWTSNCSTNSSFTNEHSATTTWSATAAGDCVLTATVGAGALGEVQTITVSVNPATGALSVSGDYVPVPAITSVSLAAPGLSCDIARDASDASCRPAIAGSTVVSAVVHFDAVPADSGTVVGLVDNCGGVPAPATVDLAAGTASFTWTAPASTASCLLSATVSRQGLSDTETVGVAVK